MFGSVGETHTKLLAEVDAAHGARPAPHAAMDAAIGGRAHEVERTLVAARRTRGDRSPPLRVLIAPPPHRQRAAAKRDSVARTRPLERGVMDEAETVLE